jgi:N-acetylglucosaminyldiphosphoundecaprenol N-acetyl-beta-D-mannosaminyltransferase
MEAFFAFRPANNYVCVSNVHTTVESRTNARFRDIQNGSFLTIADGQPIVLYGRLAGERHIERIMGPDIMTQVFADPACRERRHYFLGGTPETLEAMRRNLLARFPGLRIAGMHSPPFRPATTEEDAALREEIRNSKPDYLWVCFGAPKQEYWMETHHADFPGTLLVGIGAAFAYHAGELRRAPVWAQKLGCEWIWRLMQDPRRLWKRYLRTNPVFLAMLARLVAARAFGGRQRAGT